MKPIKLLSYTGLTLGLTSTSAISAEKSADENDKEHIAYSGAWCIDLIVTAVASWFLYLATTRSDNSPRVD